MSDDFGTVNVQRGARSREIEVIRQHYRRHRESLTEMIADAPTEHLANEYRRLIGDIDASLVKLDELDRGSGAMPAMTTEAAAMPVMPGPAPGMRPLVTTYAPEENVELPQTAAEPRSRLPLIIIVTLLALAAIGSLIWWASKKDAPAAGTVVEETTAPTSTAPVTETEQATAEVTAASDALTVTPKSHDYGVIRKGTRATRQFEVANHTDQPITMVLARSSCRCLFYEYQALIAPRGKESVTVTVDGARAKAGALRETVRVTSKTDAGAATSFEVIATIQ
jgi:hypothetical protein